MLPRSWPGCLEAVSTPFPGVCKQGDSCFQHGVGGRWDGARPDRDPGWDPGFLKLLGSMLGPCPTLRPLALWGRLWWQLLLTDASTSCGIKHQAGVGGGGESQICADRGSGMRERLSSELGGAPALQGMGERCDLDPGLQGLPPPKPRCPCCTLPMRPAAGAIFPGQDVGAKPTLGCCGRS